MQRNFFIAKYKDSDGNDRTIKFNKSEFDEATATELLESKGVKNFMFFFMTNDPIALSETEVLFKGEIGWDIDSEILLPYLKSDKTILIDSFGGDLWEGLKIYDLIKTQGFTPKIKVLGSCASSATLIFLATSKENRSMSENSRFLIHNAWTWIEGNQHDFQTMANDLKKEDLQLATIYSNNSNKSTEDILELMKKEVFINSKEVAELGMMDINSNNIDTNINTKTDMDETKIKDELTGVQNAIHKLKALFSGKSAEVQNIVLSDTNGNEIDFPTAQTEEEIVTGTEGCTVNNEVANGAYTMQNGTIYTFESGTLTDISATEEASTTDDVAIEETVELQAKINALTSENETLEAEKRELKTEKTRLENLGIEFEAKIKDLSTQIADIQNAVSVDKPEIVTPVEKKEENLRFKYTKK